jgi:hypothetical protein
MVNYRGSMAFARAARTNRDLQGGDSPHANIWGPDRQIGELRDVVTTGPTTFARAASHNHFDVRAMTGSLCERCVAGDDHRTKRLRQSNVHGVVRRHVVAQLPRSSQKIEVGVTMEVEVDKVLDRFGRTIC